MSGSSVGSVTTINVGTSSGWSCWRVTKVVVVVLVACFLVVQYSYTTIFVANSSSVVAQWKFLSQLTSDEGGDGLANKTDKGNQVLVSSSYQMFDKHMSPSIKQNDSEINGTKELCPLVSPHLLGAVMPLKEAPSTLDEVEEDLLRKDALPSFGGQWQPPFCRSRSRVALIIPYRDRANHLRAFLQHMHPFLQRQQINYGIFIVEQAGDGPFNRAMLMNVGALEAQKLGEGSEGAFDCYIFHDIDLLPEDDRNIYSCPDQPRHMSVAVNTLNYRLPYTDIFGGVSALSRKHFELVNGFSNVFWGWGGEDDDMSTRLRTNGLHIIRYPPQIARYTMMTHVRQEGNPKRFNILYSAKQRFKTDGLNSLQYKRLELRQNRSYTWMLVELGAPS